MFYIIEFLVQFTVVILYPIILPLNAHLRCQIGYLACNKEENFLTWERFLQPKVSFGVSMQSMIGKDGSSDMVRYVWLLPSSLNDIVTGYCFTSIHLA